MFRLGCLQTLSGRIFTLPTASLPSECRISSTQHTPIARLVRYASQSGRSRPQPKIPLPGKSAQLKNPEPYVRKRQVDPSKKASSLLNHLSKAKEVSRPKFQLPAPKVTAKPAKNVKAEVVKDDEDLPRDQHEKGVYRRLGNVVDVDKNELAVQKRIIRNRRKILWPGIWTIFALTGTWGTLAFLDTMVNVPDPLEISHPAERISIPQSWVLWPSVAWEGIKAGWIEVDKLTIGLVVVTAGLHLLRRSPLPIWEKMMHITGEKMYTTFTYPFVHFNWEGLITNMFLATWFVPGVVHYFDGDIFQAAALFMSVPLITSYGAHFAFRLYNIGGIPMNMGFSGVAAASFGAFCVAYPDEKVWLPAFTIFRLDAKYCSAAFIGWQVAHMLKPQRGGLRTVHLVHFVSAAMGAAYIYFDGNNQIWKPLVTRFANASKTPAQP